MARPKSNPLTDREAEIMELLWSSGQATAEEVRAALRDEPHDSTVRTLLRVLETKGHVSHDVAGKVYVYRPRMPRARAQGTAIKMLLKRFFGGSAESLVVKLLEEEHLSQDDLKELLRREPPEKKPRSQGGKSDD